MKLFSKVRSTDFSLCYTLASIFLGGMFTPIEGVPPSSSTNKSVSASKGVSSAQEQREEYNLLNRDQIDNSNTLAIPFDDSEIEDEEEINRDEDEEVFPLPNSR